MKNKRQTLIDFRNWLIIQSKYNPMTKSEIIADDYLKSINEHHEKHRSLSKIRRQGKFASIVMEHKDTIMRELGK